MAPQPGQSLNVIALISGGKDSFYSLLHCIANGHCVVALANLHPEVPDAAVAAAGVWKDVYYEQLGDGVTVILPGPAGIAEAAGSQDSPVHEQKQRNGASVATLAEAPPSDDLNSFMYQTVGHEVLPLYAAATGLPLYRRAITGHGAVQAGREYVPPTNGDDETESMIPLLRAVMAAHPSADALCAGAVLSTYQRTRVESVAVRLGLAPLALLWQLPALGGHSGDAQLLADMAAVGLEARIIKVASGGLDESFLWENAVSTRGIARIERAMARFGTAAGRGAVLGEGGEFETLVVDGPMQLFRGRIVAEEEDRNVVREGGGTAWLRVRRAMVEYKANGSDGRELGVRIPDLLDQRFAEVLAELLKKETSHEGDVTAVRHPQDGGLGLFAGSGELVASNLRQWTIYGQSHENSSIEAETVFIVEQVKVRLWHNALQPTAIINTIILLRHMSDFPTINKIYGTLFSDPNPPARVTISCGNLLPSGCNIAISLTVHSELAIADRQGLHVQSRSYWAPANIGPYSQAIAVPLLNLSSASFTEHSAPQLVHIAGQIPLVPANMSLPEDKDLCLQLALTLQHLWRIGAEMGVAWWTSAVAYIPRARRGAESAKESAVLAGRAWTAAHRWSHGQDSDDGSDEEGRPDLWDRKFDSRYATFDGGEDDARKRGLPDWSVLETAAQLVPFVFVAEVEELPRQADVEWHAHAGLAHVDDKSIQIISSIDSSATAQHTIAKTPRDGGFWVQSILALRYSGSADEERVNLTNLMSKLNGLVISQLHLSHTTQTTEKFSPSLIYVDEAAFTLDEIDTASGNGQGDYAVIPCSALWDAKGEQLKAVAVYQTHFEMPT